MGNSKIASANSVWLKDYIKRTTDKKAKSDAKKGPILMIVIPVMLGGVVGYLVANGGLNDPQTVGTIKILAIIAGIILLFGILLIALGKKKNVTSRTEDSLNEILKTAEEVKAFDEQMAAPPIFVVEEDANHCFAATKDYLYRKFSDLGNETYDFARLKDIASIHYVSDVTAKGTVLDKPYIVDLRDKNGNVLMNGNISNTVNLNIFKEYLASVIADLETKEEKAVL